MYALAQTCPKAVFRQSIFYFSDSKNICLDCAQHYIFKMAASILLGLFAIELAQLFQNKAMDTMASTKSWISRSSWPPGTASEPGYFYVANEFLFMYLFVNQQINMLQNKLSISKLLLYAGNVKINWLTSGPWRPTAANYPAFSARPHISLPAQSRGPEAPSRPNSPRRDVEKSACVKG